MAGQERMIENSCLAAQSELARPTWYSGVIDHGRDRVDGVERLAGRPAYQYKAVLELVDSLYLYG